MWILEQTSFGRVTINYTPLYQCMTSVSSTSTMLKLQVPRYCMGQPPAPLSCPAPRASNISCSLQHKYFSTFALAFTCFAGNTMHWPYFNSNIVSHSEQSRVCFVYSIVVSYFISSPYVFFSYQNRMICRDTFIKSFFEWTDCCSEIDQVCDIQYFDTPACAPGMLVVSVDGNKKLY